MSAAVDFSRYRVAKFKKFQQERLKGKDGTAGPQGPVGVIGATGAKGERGDTGPQGDSGPRGPQGPIGPQGMAGHNGVDGVVGAQGEMGQMPKHETRGDAIRFEQMQGVWGKWIHLPNLQHQQNLSVGSIQESEVIALIQQFGGAAVAEDNILIDTAGDYKYIGFSTPGTATSAASWKIKRVDQTDSGGDVPILFASGTADYNKVWDDRATYTYTPTGA